MIVATCQRSSVCNQAIISYLLLTHMVDFFRHYYFNGQDMFNAIFLGLNRTYYIIPLF